MEIAELIDQLNDCRYICELAYFLPKPCKNECTASGDKYSACKRWVERLQLNIPNDICIDNLKEYGVWENDELEEDSNKELNIKMIWLAAGYE